LKQQGRSEENETVADEMHAPVTIPNPGDPPSLPQEIPYPAACLAPQGFEHALQGELQAHGIGFHALGRLHVLQRAPATPPAWAQHLWHEPRRIQAPSISQAAKALKAIQRNWVCYSHAHHRRAALIQEQLPPVSARPHRFGDPLPTAPLGAWPLLDEHPLLAAPRCNSPFPLGEVRFVEDKTGPPSRAYLKLWELFTRLDRQPEPGALCLDLGASPGGWSWVLARLGCRVLAVDRAPLDPRVAALPGVTERRGSAFGIDPRASNNDVHPDWIFSDVICYPARLLEYIRRWITYGHCRNFVCTLKFQGETDYATMQGFLEIGGTLLHLSHNKHELTWVLTSA